MSNDIFLKELTPIEKAGEIEYGSGFPIKRTHSDQELVHKTLCCQRNAAIQAPTLHIDRVRTIYHGQPRILTTRARSKKIDIAK